MILGYRGGMKCAWFYYHHHQLTNVRLDDATCVIVPKMEQYFSLAHASARQVTEAARAVMQTCVIARRIGGTARMIGGFFPNNDPGKTIRVLKASIFRRIWDHSFTLTWQNGELT